MEDIGLEIKTGLAIKAELRRWKNIMKGSSDEGLSSPLCELFHLEECVGCPVRIHTGYKDCRGSVYAEWTRHHCEAHFRTEAPYVCHSGCDTCLHYAEKVHKSIQSAYKHFRNPNQLRLL